MLPWVKLIEALVRLRPKALWRTTLQPEPRLRHVMRWYAEMGHRVWLYELQNFYLRGPRARKGPTLGEFWGQPQDAEEKFMTSRPGPVRAPALLESAKS